MQTPFAQQVDFTRYLNLFWKRKWFILAPTVIFPVVTALQVMQLPDRYKSTTLILVQAQKVPSQFVASTVTTGIQERLQTISQQILSRTRLEEIIREFDLFAREKKSLTPEEIVDLMRGKIQLQVHRNDAFQLSYIDANPRLAMLVTNKLASLFIEENLKVREQQAIGTGQFLGDEIERVREQVREKETLILSYKQRHLSELSDQVASNNARLNQLQNQLQINTQNINAAEDRKVKLQQQLAEIERRVHEDSEARKESRKSQELSISDELAARFKSAETGGSAADDSAVKAIEAEIAKQKRDLDSLKLTYTEKHPEILRRQSQIKRLEKEADRARQAAEQRANEARAKAKETRAESPPAPDLEVRPQYPAAYQQIKAEVARAEVDVKRLRAQNEEIQNAIEVYQRRIGAVPAREMELKKISEDYDNLKSVLENLVNKKLQADLSENLEKKQKGEQFQVLDPANLPEKPFYPKRLQFVGGGLGAGAALGFGLVLVFDILNFTVRTKADLEASVALPVIGTIPEIVTAGDLRRRKAWRLGIAGGLAACALIAAVVVHVAVKPIPKAIGDLVSQARATHWTTIR